MRALGGILVALFAIFVGFSIAAAGHFFGVAGAIGVVVGLTIIALLFSYFADVAGVGN